MNVRKAIVTRLLANSDLTAIVGTRIYRGRLPEHLEPPHIIVWLLRNERIYDQDGYTGLSQALVQISCFAYDPDDALDAADLVKASMEAWPTESGDVASVFIEDESDGLEEETEIFHVPLDVRINYREEV